MPQQETSLRARKRRAVQDEVTLAAIELFIANGFDETPVEKIAAAVGMSERTFFRYFSTKDDVLERLSTHWRTHTAQLLAERPADEPTWVAIRRALDAFVESTTTDEFALPLLRLLYTTPHLYGRHMLKMRLWREGFGAAIQQRRPDEDEQTVRIQAAVAVACFESAREAWVACDGTRPLAELLDAAMAEVWPIA